MSIQTEKQNSKQTQSINHLITNFFIMKINKLFVAALAATALLASCSKENATSTNAGTQTIAIKLSGNVAVRGVENPVGTTTPVLSDVTVFLLNGNSVVKVEEFLAADLTNKSKVCENVPASVNKVVVVANRKGVTINNQTNADAIKKLFTVANQNNSTGVEDKTLMGEGVPAAGNTLGLDPVDGHPYKEVNIPLDALTARIEIGDVAPGVGVERVELVGVWINNYYTDGSKAGPQLNSATYTGWPVIPTSPSVSDISAPTVTPSDYSALQYCNAWNSRVVLNPIDQVYAYQVFASNVPHIIMLVKGVYASNYYDEVAGTKYFIGYVTFNKFLDASSNEITAFVANKIYKIGVDANGVKIDAKDINEKPETGKIDVGIKVTVSNWTPQNITPGVQ